MAGWKAVLLPAAPPNNKQNRMLLQKAVTVTKAPIAIGDAAKEVIGCLFPVTSRKLKTK